MRAVVMNRTEAGVERVAVRGRADAHVGRPGVVPRDCCCWEKPRSGLPAWEELLAVDVRGLSVWC